MEIAIYVAIWFVSGLAGFAFWWTREDDLTAAQLPIGFISALTMGPITWIIGGLIHGKSRVLIHKRKSK